MKKLLTVAGIVELLIIILSFIFKVNHLPSSDTLFAIGFVTTALFFALLIVWGIVSLLSYKIIDY